MPVVNYRHMAAIDKFDLAAFEIKPRIGYGYEAFETDELPGNFGAVAICVGIEFGAISSMTRLPDHAARSMI